MQEDTQSKIPKIIWQTAKSFPPPQAKTSILSWINNNPEYEWCFMDDERCDLFIKENFSLDFYKMYSSLPLGVMKADVWRIAVVYAYGGVYADIDTECIVSIKEWCKGPIVVAEETPCGNIANYTFAAVPKHPALGLALSNLMDKWKSNNTFNAQSNTPVQDFGQHAFDCGIKQYKTLFPHQINTIPFKDKRFTNSKLPTTFVWHQVASFTWKQNYNRWREEEKQLLGMLNK